MSEFCYKQKKLNPTRTITRFKVADRMIHTDWNCLMEQYQQTSTIGHGRNSITTQTGRFKIKK